MSLIVLKILLPPLLLAAASLAGRRWGDAIGGWLVGLPLTSGPVSAFLAVQYGADFAARATDGSLTGAASQAAFSLAYALLAARGATAATLAGTLSYAGAAAALQALPLPHWGFFLAALIALTGALAFLPHRPFAGDLVAPPRWDLPARAILATLLVVALTAAGAYVGPRLAGVFASFPVFGAILTVFAHKMRGPEMGRNVLRGMVLALYGFATFFFVLGLALPALGVLPAFVAAGVCAGAAQAGTLAVMRRAERKPLAAPVGRAGA